MGFSQLVTSSCNLVLKHVQWPCMANTVWLMAAGDAAEWEMAIALNPTAPILLTKAFAGGMVKNKVCCQQQPISWSQ